MTDAPPPDTSPRIRLEALFSQQANVSAVLVTTILIIGLIKLSSLLPDRYYFSFTKFAGDDQASPFIVQPAHLEYAEICRLAKEKKIDLKRFCQTEDEEASSEESSTPAPPAAENPGKEITAPTGQNAAATDASSEESEESAAPSSEESNEAPAEEAGYDEELQAEDKRIAELVKKNGQGQSMLALLIRSLIPLAAGFIVGRFYADSAFPAAALGGALAALLLCWPIILLWDQLFISDEWKGKQNLLYAMYIIYIVLFLYLADLGARLTTIRSIRNWRADWWPLVDKIVVPVVCAILIKVLENLIV